MIGRKSRADRLDAQDRQALEWLNHFLVEDVTRAYVAAFRRWRAEGPMQEAAWARAVRMRKMLIALEGEGGSGQRGRLPQPAKTLWGQFSRACRHFVGRLREKCYRLILGHAVGSV